MYNEPDVTMVPGNIFIYQPAIGAVILLFLIIATILLLKVEFRVKNNRLSIIIMGINVYKITFGISNTMRFLRISPKEDDEKKLSDVISVIKAIRKSSLIEIFKKKAIIKRINLECRIDATDASLTAKITGIIWMIAGIMQSLVINNFNVDNINILVLPEFSSSKPKFKIEAEFRIRIRIIHIIHAMLEIIKIKGVVVNDRKLYERKRNTGKRNTGKRDTGRSIYRYEGTSN